VRVEQNGASVTVDLHGLTAEDARCRLSHLIDGLPAQVREVRVIHGCNHGQALLEMVRGDFRHARVSAKLPALNPGETRLLLK
jgi:DNA-nicking Smr family endonuclease